MSGDGLLTGLRAASLSGAVIILAVLLLRTALQNRTPRRVFCLWWDAALARLLILTALPSPVSVWQWVPVPALLRRPGLDGTVIPGPGLTAPAAEAVIGNTAIVPGTTAPPPVSAPDTGTVLTAVWLTVGWALAAWFFWSHLRSRWLYADSLPCGDAFVRAWLPSHRLRRSIQVRTSDRIAAPLTHGVLRPVILLPSMIDWTDKAGLSCILDHEYQHVRRFDTLRKALLAAALCLHWFSPLVWALYVLSNQDMELACDEAVTARGVDRAEYARTLLSMEEQRGKWGLSGSHFSQNALEERIRCIMRHKKSSFAALLTVLAVMCVTVAAFASNPPEPKTEPPQDTSAPGFYRDSAVEDITLGSGTPEAAESESGIEDEIGAGLEPYRAFGLSYEYESDGEPQLRMSWHGKPVHSLYDTETGTWYANNMHGTELGDDAVDLETVYRGGKLCGLQESQPPHEVVHSAVATDTALLDRGAGAP